MPAVSGHGRSMSDANIHMISLASMIIYAVYDTALLQIDAARRAGMLFLHAQQACVQAAPAFGPLAKMLARLICTGITVVGPIMTVRHKNKQIHCFLLGPTRQEYSSMNLYRQTQCIHSSLTW